MKEKNFEVELFTQVKNGSEKAMEIIFHEYYSKLCLYVFSIIKDKYLSEDIVIELFTTLWLKRDKIEIATSLKSYLYTAARNNSLVYLKKRKIFTQSISIQDNQIDSGNLDISDKLDDEKLYNSINEVLNKIPPRSRQVFILHRFEEMKYKEIAEFLNISVKTVDVHIGKAMKVLHANKSILNRLLKLIIFMLLLDRLF